MTGSEFVFDYVHLYYYIQRCHKINPDCGESYIDSPNWIKNKKTKRNLINEKDNKCFQCAIIIALNHREIGKNSERTTKVKLFINKSNWQGINFPSGKDDWKKLEKNNRSIALTVLYAKK